MWSGSNPSRPRGGVASTWATSGLVVWVGVGG